ncbi:MAG: MgtC/SapB family protein [Oscillospiraceae bacterium]|nr:MgtC/SapB family protein [Oscillospiraceae bacterium]
MDWLQSHLIELTTLSVTVRLLLSAVFGGLIGLDRGRRRRAAGLRTHILVCTGASLVMITNQYIAQVTGAGDVTRMGAQVISGIGFLGAGSILVDRYRQVRGLTTAAGLWASACMGLALGVGFVSGAVIACVIILTANVFLSRIERLFLSRTRDMRLYIEMETAAVFNSVISALGQHGIQIHNIDNVTPRGGTSDLRSAVTLKLYLPKHYPHGAVLEVVREIDGVLLSTELKT